MKKILFFVIILLSGIAGGCGPKIKEAGQQTPFIVRHTPNPSDKHTYKGFEKKPYPFMWFYRTEVKNISDRSIKILWFWSHLGDMDNEWTTMDNPLDNQEFINLYSGNPDAFDDQGYIMPGKTAVRDPNWRGSNTVLGDKVKHSYIGIDLDGNEYLVESFVECKPIKIDFPLFEKKLSIDISDVTLKEALEKLAEQCDGEFKFKIEGSGFKKIGSYKADNVKMHIILAHFAGRAGAKIKVEEDIFVFKVK